MKTILRVLIFTLLSVSAFAQLQTFKGDTTASLQSTRVNLGVNVGGRPGFKASTGNFRTFATIDEVNALTGGSVATVNGKVGPSVVLGTGDINESGSNQYFTLPRMRAGLTATSPIDYNPATGAFSWIGTKSSVGLGNVDNTSDANKPVSTTQQDAFNLKQNAASSIFRADVSTYAALTAYTVPAGLTYLIKVAADESQSAPYNVNQWYLKDGTTGATNKLSLIRQ